MRHLAKLIGLSVAVTFTGTFAADQASTAKGDQSAMHGQMSPNADNSSMNVRDKSGATQTPQKQPNAGEDRKLLAAVRRTVVKDKTLSKTAHNVKIVVENGVVTLRGPVKSDGEKSEIESLAKQVQGISSVNNQLDVKTN